MNCTIHYKLEFNDNDQPTVQGTLIIPIELGLALNKGDEVEFSGKWGFVVLKYYNLDKNELTIHLESFRP